MAEDATPRPIVRGRGREMVEVIATADLYGQAVEVRNVTSCAVAERLQIRAYQGEQTARLCLVDGDDIVAFQQVCIRSV